MRFSRACEIVAKPLPTFGLGCPRARTKTFVKVAAWPLRLSRTREDLSETLLYCGIASQAGEGRAGFERLPMRKHPYSCHVSRAWRPMRKRCRELRFHGHFLRPENFWLQKGASLRNAARTLTPPNTERQPWCATQRTRTQKLFLELEIRCSIRLSYGRKCDGNMSPSLAENPARIREVLTD
jgi:hypothetical protein